MEGAAVVCVHSSSRQIPHLKDLLEKRRMRTNADLCELSNTEDNGLEVLGFFN